MKTFKKLLSLLLALAMVLSLAAMITGCKKDNGTDDPAGQTTGSANNGESGTYHVSVKTNGGMPLKGVAVYIYGDAEKTDLKEFGETNEEGKVSFDLPKAEYVIDLEGVAAGYDVKDTYFFSGNAAEIVLTSSLVTGESLSGASLGLGDVMYDFSVATPDGKTVTLSEVLAENKVVLLNFFFTTCSPCINEFPYMQEAYDMYKDAGAAVIAIDPMPSDNNNSVAAFQSSMGLTFPMAACEPTWSNAFSITGYPTSIIIDRYGVICLIEVGGLTSLRPFTSIFEYFTADDYKQQVFNSLDEIVTRIKPTYEMPTPEEITATINNGDLPITYRGDEDEYSWPFVIGEKNGEQCIYASNKMIEASYGILYADVQLKAGQAIGFDYLASCENGSDVLHVIVDDQPIYTISGVDEKETWKSAYPWVATEDGTYEVALCYMKDESEDMGDDTVYVKNMRIIDAKDIDAATYIPQQAATSADGFEFNYVNIVYNEKDGYFHVGTANGPLLLVDMMGYTQFSQDESLWDLAYNGSVTVDGHSYYEDMVDYFSFASNSSLQGVCTVTKELADLMMIVDKTCGFDDADDKEWLKFCKYYQAYGTNGQQLEDPIKGLAPFSAFEAKLGKNIPTNFFYYNTAIIPRGKLAKFVPSKSGVYRITSRNESAHGVDAWIFNENREELLVYEMNERMWNDSDNVSMLYYMKAGEAYYIDIAFWDVYEAGYIYYDIEFVASEYDVFRLCSSGYFTYDSDASGDAIYDVIAGGIDVIMGTDGYFHEDLGKDANGKQKYGSIIYADFTGVTSLFSNPIATVPSYDENGKPILDANGKPSMFRGMIDMGGFDFSKTSDDLYVLSVLEKYNGNEEEALAYLKTFWAEDYDANYEIYKVEDVLEGRFHGTGKDLTAEISAYLSKMYQGSAKERVGCVPVDQKLADLLQALMDKYTFEDVENSWIKLCYYYDHLGPNG